MLNLAIIIRTICYIHYNSKSIIIAFDIAIT